VRLVQQELAALRLDLTNPAPADLAWLFPVPVGKIRLEIGFGGGEHLIHRAIHAPDCGFIGVEPFVNSMAKLLAKVESLGLKNIRLHDDDATVVLDWLPAGSIDQIDLLYPDPWPKTRTGSGASSPISTSSACIGFLNPAGCSALPPTSTPMSTGRCSMSTAMVASNGFANNASDWLTPYPDWPSTRYEAKARREGRSSAYLTFRKN